ncbi:fasciclin domain-containing protein [Sphingomonas sp. CJ99]
MNRLGLAGALAIGLALSACGGNEAGVDGNAAAEASVTDDTLYEVIAETADLKTAAALMKSAGLERTFNGVGSYTVFVPVDTAFTALPAEQRTALEAEAGRPQLVSLLRAHVATGYISRDDLDQGLAKDGGTAKLASVSGSALSLRKDGDAILIGEGEEAARIVGEPIRTRNGVVYRIDRIIPPPAA